MKSLIRLVGLVAWVVTALVAINIGLIALGYNIAGTAFIANNIAPYGKAIAITVGVLGLISLLMLSMACVGCDCKDDNCSCHP